MGEKADSPALPVGPHPTASPSLWEGRLSDLLGSMTADLYALGGGRGIWIGRTIRAGYVVSLCIYGEDGTRHCRISMDSRPASAIAWGRFHAAVEMMVQHLGIAHWVTIAPTLGPGEVLRGALMEYAEPNRATAA